MNISLTSIKQSVITILHRYHVVLFVLTIVGGLVAVILLLNSIIISSSNVSTYTSPDDATFDQATINRIEQLKSSTDNGGQPTLPSGRTNPFVE